MADERIPFRSTKWLSRNPNPVARGAEHGTPIPLIRGIKSRLKALRGPSEDELAQWQSQIQAMQKEGFAWNEKKKMWQRGDQFAEPWAQPWMYPKEKG